MYERTQVTKPLFMCVAGKRWKDGTTFGDFFDEWSAYTSYDDTSLEIGADHTRTIKANNLKQLEILPTEAPYVFDLFATIWDMDPRPDITWHAIQGQEWDADLQKWVPCRRLEYQRDAYSEEELKSMGEDNDGI